jgi:arylsulfatase A-like enzyme
MNLADGKTRAFLAAAALAAVLTTGPGRPAAAGTAGRPRPNIVVLVADDLGYGDLGFQGCTDVPTPNIDALARSGVMFTDAYVSAPVCSPCRAGLLTGRYQTRFGHEFNTPGADQYQGGMPRTERTFADRLREEGYATGHVGKWHLGNPKLAGYGPNARGFAESLWFPGQKKVPPLTLFRDGKPEKNDLETSGAIAREACAFIDRHGSDPFFLYVAFQAVHEPFDVSEEAASRFDRIPDPKRRRLAALLAAMDQAVGRISAGLQAAGLEQDTLVVFLSDNGSYPKSTGSNAPLRGSKGTTWEGGIRVPFVMKWAGRLQAGQVYRRPIIQLDIAATALSVAGVMIRPDWKLDGVDLIPYLTGSKPGDPHEALLWRYGPQRAIRSGPWKLVQALEDGSSAVSPPRLFDVAGDRSESHDLAAAQPETVRALDEMWRKWDAELVAPLWTDGNQANASPPAQ